MAIVARLRLSLFISITKYNFRGFWYLWRRLTWHGLAVPKLHSNSSGNRTGLVVREAEDAGFVLGAEEQDHAPMGEARDATLRAKRPEDEFGLHLRRHLSCTAPLACDAAMRWTRGFHSWEREFLELNLINSEYFLRIF
jgi:hypothetical protein